MECPGDEHRSTTVALSVLLLLAAIGYVATQAVDKKRSDPSAAFALLIGHMQVLGVVSRMVRARSLNWSTGDSAAGTNSGAHHPDHNLAALPLAAQAPAPDGEGQMGFV